MSCLDDIIDSTDTNVSEFRETVVDRGAWPLQSMGSQKVEWGLATTTGIS